MRKGGITLKILEAVSDLAINTIDLFEVFLSVGYGASYGKFQYELSKKQRERDQKSIEREMKNKAKQNYYNLIYQLKRGGLIEEKEKNNKKFFIITKKGKGKLSFLKKQHKESLPEVSYSSEENNKFIIFIFDIPEKEKRKRDWLREVLKKLGLKMIQKSVWIGKTKIPKEFLDDLFKLKIIDYVEIFEITKAGSLKNLV
ncbi:CRISPR-associated endonuclease Cas2 [Candidatus Wolfebacteria bacterium CG_4_10_14_0_2_um_filter_39_18]|uniref:CRISPR-associated endonuclease Cas2 n=1 Tax=Candidatus Wolfebacteria bacterium CG_4_10_14_0_2_um_filter_39_18 TaxID=1975061 RepID=A0A2M7TH59_9BACT|nr:MAG: CRISPR-associated endonuclease Cas2 [Candidatus Wolfebacteria bacterium CG_4_10_14_0_2_um_filter_39_18]